MSLQTTLSSIDWTVIDELQHLPTGAEGSPQEKLRHEYAVFRTLHRRMNADMQPHDALVQAIVNVKRHHPDFTPRYDASFFVAGSTIAATLANDELAQSIQAMAANGGHYVGSEQRKAVNR
jgi:DNA gyrase inhibitor GyrI